MSQTMRADPSISIPEIPSGRSKVHETFWQLLAHRHDQLADAAEIARRHCIQAIEWEVLTSVHDAGKQISHEIQAARAEFADDLRREQEWLDFKAGRRPIPSSVVGTSRDWRSRRRLQPVWPFLLFEVRWSFWQILAYQHDGLAEEAANARQDFDQAGRQLREAISRYSDRPAEKADAVIAEHIEHARDLFEQDLWREKNVTWFSWRDRRGRRWVR